MVRKFPAILSVVIFRILALSAWSIDLPPRKQWNANGGYCGEASLISAGMHFGQYCSQFTARKAASPHAKQSDRKSQLLVGVNDRRAAKAMKLEAQTFNFAGQNSTAEFVSWIKGCVARGYPTAIGVFLNSARFDEDSPVDEEYDHIVMVTGMDGKKSPGAGVIRFGDHGLYAPDDHSVFPFSLPLARFLHSRSSANNPASPIYSLKDQPPHYGIAITGVADRDGVTIPVRLTASRNDEPEISDRSNAPPPTAPLRLTATVSIPDQSVAYKLYRYESFEKVPVRAFNANADKAAQVWNIPPRGGASFKVSHDTHTGATVVFRAVPASAP